MYENNIIERYKLHGRILIYLRKSREEMLNGFGGGVEFTLERHEEILQTWSKQNLGFEIPGEDIFREVGSGETIRERPVMQEVMKILKSNDVVAILVIEPQRLSRGMKDSGELIEVLEFTDTKVLTPTKIYNLIDKYDKKVFRDELLRGSEFLEYVKERLNSGRQLSCSQGKLVGQAPFGYDKVKLENEKGFKAAPNKDSEVVKLIFKMFIEGYTPFQIATHLRDTGANTRTNKEWEHGAVKQILVNPFYYGYQTWQARKTTKKFIDGEIKTVREKNPEVKVYKGLHTPIISEDDFMKVQKIIKNRSTPRTTSKYETQNPLASIVKCGLCGRSMARQIHTGEVIKKRKYDLDKTELQKYIKHQKNKLNMSHKEIYIALEIPKHYVYGWFSTPNKFYPSDMFIAKWEELKEVLRLKDTKFDKALTEFVDTPKPDTLACLTHSCSCTSSHLHLVEKEILQVIAARLENYRNYLDNYEVEYVKELEDNEKIIKKLDKEITSLNKELKTALRNYNRGDYDREEFLELKEELTEELEVLKNKRLSLATNKEDKIIIIKRAIPILSKCLEYYPTLQPKDKNKLLKTILSEVYYTKQGKNSDFKIEPKFKI